MVVAVEQELLFLIIMINLALEDNMVVMEEMLEVQQFEEQIHLLGQMFFMMEIHILEGKV